MNESVVKCYKLILEGIIDKSLKKLQNSSRWQENRWNVDTDRFFNMRYEKKEPILKKYMSRTEYDFVVMLYNRNSDFKNYIEWLCS